jgi:hypothetical protein
MYFFEAKLKKQRKILLEIMPHLTAVLEELQTFSKKQSGGEKSKAAKEAQADLTAKEAAALVKKDDPDIKIAAVEARVKAALAFDEAKSEEIENGFALISDAVDALINRQYGGVLAIISALYGTTPEALEEEKSLFDIIDMIYETLGNEKLARFFPQLQRFAPKTQSDI